MKIKAVLLDSGRVLNRSATGHWFIPPRFFEYVDKQKWDGLNQQQIAFAFRAATKYIVDESLIQTKDEELLHFRKYYQIFSAKLPELGLTDEQTVLLASDLVNNAKKYVFYDDALRVIPALKKRYQLAVVSDAWPSLVDVFKENGVCDCFDTFVISSAIGVTKPDAKMYLTALEKLKVSPEEAVFVDDNPANCLGAMKVGIHAVLLCRNKWQYLLQKLLSVGKGYRVIRSLDQLERVIER